MKKGMICAVLLSAAALASAAGVAGAGGNTIAGSEKKQTLAVEMSRTLASGLSNLDDQGTDVCATIVNRSEKTGVIRLTLSDFAAASTFIDIAKSKSAALCQEDAESVAVNCVGPSKCAYTWSIDKF